MESHSNIPGIENSHTYQVTDYRLIAWCNVFYKVISKVLTTRIATVAEHLLHPAQTAFVKGRTITDNIHLAHELLRSYIRKWISPRCMLKVDLHEAFDDSVHWNFLLVMLQELQFPPRFIGWIRACITTITFSLSINGSIHGFFCGARGLR